MFTLRFSFNYLNKIINNVISRILNYVTYLCHMYIILTVTLLLFKIQSNNVFHENINIETFALNVFKRLNIIKRIKF